MNDAEKIEKEKKVKIPRQKRFRAAKPIGRAAKEALFGQSWFDEFRAARNDGGDARKSLDDDEECVE